jgi:hypothetical protein
MWLSVVCKRRRKGQRMGKPGTARTFSDILTANGSFSSFGCCRCSPPLNAATRGNSFLPLILSGWFISISCAAVRPCQRLPIRRPWPSCSNKLRNPSSQVQGPAMLSNCMHHGHGGHAYDKIAAKSAAHEVTCAVCARKDQKHS